MSVTPEEHERLVAAALAVSQSHARLWRNRGRSRTAAALLGPTSKSARPEAQSRPRAQGPPPPAGPDRPALAFESG